MTNNEIAEALINEDRSGNMLNPEDRELLVQCVENELFNDFTGEEALSRAYDVFFSTC